MPVASWYHLSVKPVSRSAGRSVVAAAAYRLGERLNDERAHLVHDYRQRSGVEASFTMSPAGSPEWAFEPERLWNAAEVAERRSNSTLAREIELALPALVTAEARLSIVEAIAAELVDRYGVAVSAAIHRPSSHGDSRNHHAHILFTTREMMPDGLGAKTRVLDDRKSGPLEVRYLRELACGFINDALADAGSDERVDHRSFEARGIDQEPTTHLGPTASEMERKGVGSELGDDNRAVAERNADRRKLEELEAEHASIEAEIAELLAQPERAPEEIAPAAGPFEEVHAETLVAARAESDAMADEDGDTRFARARTWFSNLLRSFADWSDQLLDRAAAFGIRWSRTPDESREVDRE